MPRVKKSGVYRVKKTGFVASSGRERCYQEGELVAGSNPDVAAHPALFEPVEEWVNRQGSRYQVDVEQATASPGEKRSVPTRPAKRVQPKAPAAKPVVDGDGDA